MTLSTQSLELSIRALERAVGVMQDTALLNAMPNNVQELLRSGVIHSFEVGYEQSWKMMKRWLELNASPTEIDGVSRRQLFRLASESQLIEDVDQWMLFHKARNETSHVYDLAKAQAVFEIAIEFLTAAQKLQERLKSSND